MHEDEALLRKVIGTLERAARCVAGANLAAAEREVRHAAQDETADREIAGQIRDAFAWNVLIPGDQIRVTVENGRAYLSGEVELEYQSREATRVAARVTGVTGVSDGIAIAQQVPPGDVRKRIMEAFERQAEFDARGVTVAVEGHTVTLGGKVPGWFDRQAAERVAWAGPGVTQVIDRMAVHWTSRDHGPRPSAALAGDRP